MIGLKMHWRLIQESDGGTHLNMQWEAAHSGLMRGFTRTQTHSSAKSYGRLQSARVMHSRGSESEP
jgi:hypothetical protein